MIMAVINNSGLSIRYLLTYCFRWGLGLGGVIFALAALSSKGRVCKNAQNYSIRLVLSVTK